MLNTDQDALRRILLQQPAADFRAFLLPTREPLTKHRALQLLDSGTFVFKTDKRRTRVKWLQAIETAPEYPTLPPVPVRIAIWQRCYRTVFAPVLQPGIEWGR